MKIIDKIKQEGVHLSFEVFPPKTDTGYKTVSEAAEKIASLKPSFISVTYGASGGTSVHTKNLARQIYRDFHVESLAHLTCASLSKEEVEGVIDGYMEAGIENILALRGDYGDAPQNTDNQYKYAYELIEVLKKKGDFCIGAACYPEGHVECNNRSDDISHLQQKVACGVDFLTTQMFFDNQILYTFLYKIREKGITIPVIPGIMPVTNGSQIKRICELSGTKLPERFVSIVDRFSNVPAAMEQAGIAYAIDQIIDLIANGLENIHIYTMNKPHIAEAILSGLSEIIS